MIISILIIDDHPSQIEGYKAILSLNEAGYEFKIVEAYSCKNACKIIMNPNNIGEFQLVFLDLNLPAYAEKDIQSGDDLAVLIRKTWPDTPIIILTSHCESIVLYNTAKKADPEGIMVKSDFTGNELLGAIDKILNGGKYYTETASVGIRELISRENFLDGTNREIIMLLSKGIKTKNMPEFLNISLSSIEKRKQGIKDYLHLKRGTDEDIVTRAKKLGLI